MMNATFTFDDLVAAMNGTDDNVLSTFGDAAVRASGIAHDSRQVGPGDVFVAISGTASDGHAFVADAVGAGAAALVVEAPPASVSVPWVQVRSARVALGRAARMVHGAPSESLRIFAVTGTNGKTTVAWILRHLLGEAGISAAFLGTVGYDPGTGMRPAHLTTPDALELHGLLAEALEAGLGAVVLEASSHALALDRLEGVDVDVGIFTNLTRDHLDYHGDLDGYREAKMRLADLIGVRLGGGLVYNAADPAWNGLRARAPKIAHLPFDPSVSGPLEDRVTATILTESLDGTDLVLHVPGQPDVEVTVPLPGRLNVENVLAAVAAATLVGLDPTRVAAALAVLPPVPGRLEPVGGPQGSPRVLVDFAHTPDAVDRTLRDVRLLCKGRVLAVFGCGGDRDRGKRPLMGAAAERHSDLAVLTSDNPRSESPEVIAQEVLAGVSGDMEVVLDRRQAIARALALAESPDDVVVILGKGHETNQLIGNERRPFDDRVVAAEMLALRGSQHEGRGEREGGSR